jgi:hypothetical protein
MPCYFILYLYKLTIMAAKKSSKKSSSKKTFLAKVGDKASHIKDDLIEGKDHLVEFAGEAFESIKEGIHNITKKKKTPKRAAKKSAKKVALKRVKAKAVPKKKSVKKAPVKKAAKKR